MGIAIYPKNWNKVMVRTKLLEIVIIDILKGILGFSMAKKYGVRIFTSVAAGKPSNNNFKTRLVWTVDS